MPITYPAILQAALPGRDVAYSKEDSMVHALAIGLGSDPTDVRALAFAAGHADVAFPTLALTLGYVAMSAMNLGIDYAKMVAGGIRLESHAPLPAQGRVIATHRIVDVADLGAGRGAVIRYERELRTPAGDRLATAVFTAFCRGDGGFGGPHPSAATKRVPEDRKPDLVCELPTFTLQPLLHRLAGDIAAIHVDPAVAKAAGFDRPLLQGQVIFGMAARAIAEHFTGGDAQRIAAMEGRFSSPLYPGETLQFHFWQGAGDEIHFRGKCKERGVTVFEHGFATLHAPAQ